MNTTTISSGSIAALLVAMVAVQAAVGDISCSQVISDLSPCLAFLQGNAGQPSSQCCDGVRAIYVAADTRAARQDTCRCLEAAYDQVGALLSAAQELPRDCGVPLPIRITPDIDCDKIE